MRWFVLPLLLLFAAEVAAGESFDPKQFDMLVSPFMKKHCASCHNAKEAEGGLDLSAFKKADDLLAQRKPWQRVVRQLKAGAMPPEGHPRPNEKHVKDVIAWLEQALVYVDPSKPVDPGRVTVRRLNRTEYNHTLRDLFGVSMPLADEFSADDLGYGFDNIGDVLSVSPLRMEQYLNAAEKLTSGGLQSPQKEEVNKLTARSGSRLSRSTPARIGSSASNSGITCRMRIAAFRRAAVASPLPSCLR